MDYRLEVIERANQLPNEGGAYETLKFDMKAAPSKSEYERAKDIAAFANASGGHILVGAFEEQSSGRLLRYNPLNDKAAIAEKNVYEHANKNFCSPVPVIDARVVSINSGNVVAVTVWPFPGQIVGVKVTNNKAEQVTGTDSWCFPIRKGTQTAFLRPEHTAMLMEPRLRATSISLSHIQINGDMELHYQSLGEGFKQNQSMGAEFVECSMSDNTLIVKVNIGKWKNHELSIPLEGIDAVWHDAALRRWNVALSGTVTSYPNEKPRYSYHIAKC